jgi:hypothetical protein
MERELGRLKRRNRWLLGAILLIVVAVFIRYRFLNSHESATISSFPEQFIDDRANFVQSITVLRESSDLTQPSNNLGKAFTIPKATEQQIYAKIEEGTALSKKVDDAFLDYIHPDLKNYYRNKLIVGTEMYYEGIKANNSGDVALGVQKQMKGNNLMIEWIRWWESHNKDLSNKAYPKK